MDETSHWDEISVLCTFSSSLDESELEQVDPHVCSWNDVERLISAGRAIAVLSSNLVRSWLLTEAQDEKGPFYQWIRSCEKAEVIPSLEIERADCHRNFLLVGIAFLISFIRCNWTGPNDKVSMDELVPQSVITSSMYSSCPILLSRGGEHLQPVIRKPLLLSLGLFFVHNASDSILCRWWRARALFLLQRVLEGPALVLQDEIISLFDRVSAELKDGGAPRYLLTCANLESAIVAQYYSRLQDSEELLSAATQEERLAMELTGVLGKRMKFQSKDTAQLVLHAESSGSNCVNEPGDLVPELIRIEEDNERLERPALSCSEDDVREPQQLSSVSCAILLAWGKLLELRASSEDELAINDRRAYIECVSEYPRDFCVQTQCLWERSRLESQTPRLAARSALQLEVLSRITEQGQEGQKNSLDQIRSFFLTWFPTFRDVNGLLGSVEIALGAVKTAIECFERIESWKMVVHCLRLLGQEKKAEMLLREKLVDEKSPQILCALGDLLDDFTYFEQAWEVSKQRYAPSVRMMGQWRFSRGEYGEAIEPFQKAVVLNPAQPAVWFSLGFCFMQGKDWKRAIEAFMCVVRYEPEHAEAWGNIGYLNIRLGNKRIALSALGEALKINARSWRMWENYVLLCMDLDEHFLAVHALMQIFELTKVHPRVDWTVFHKLLEAASVLEESGPSVGKARAEPSGLALFHDIDVSVKRSSVQSPREHVQLSLKEKIEEALGWLTQNVPTHPRLWEERAFYAAKNGSFAEAVEYKLRVCQLYREQWMDGKETFSKLCASCNELLEFVVEHRSFEYEVQSLCRAISKVGRKRYEDTACCSSLEDHIAAVFGDHRK